MSRILAIVEGWPWPERSGNRIRAATLLEGLAAAGEVDLCVLGPPGHGAPPEAVPHLRRLCNRVVAVDLPARRTQPLEADARGPRPKLPSERRGWPLAPVRQSIEARLPGGYDQVWYGGAGAYRMAGRWTAARIVVDLGDLEDVRLGALAPADGVGAHLRRQRQIAGWRRLQRRIAGEADAVIVASDRDRERLGAPAASVVPDALPRPRRSGPVVRPGRPRVLVPGLRSDGPGADAADWVVQRVLPQLRRSVPDVELRLVGRGSERVQALAGPHVTVADDVPDMAAELPAADAVLVPLPYGCGTRVRILEAFTHARPVVATSSGCDGLDVAAGRHLLVADDAEEVGAALSHLLLERPLADRVARAGHGLWADRYDRSLVVRRVAALARVEQPLDHLDLLLPEATA